MENVSGFLCVSYCGSIGVLHLFSDMCVIHHIVVGTESGAFADKEIYVPEVFALTLAIAIIIAHCSGHLR